MKALFCLIAFLTFNFYSAGAQELKGKIPASSSGQRIEQDFGLGVISVKYYRHFSMRAERVKENKVWMLFADVTGEREGRIAYGSTSAINPDGDIVRQVPFMETGMIIVEI